MKKFFEKVKEMMKPNYETITSPILKDWIGEQRPIQLLDVRTLSEIQGGTIKGSKHADVMSGQLKNAVTQLDKEKDLVVFCRSGNRSKMACSFLAGQGFEKVYNLAGGYTDWIKTNG